MKVCINNISANDLGKIAEVMAKLSEADHMTNVNVRRTVFDIGGYYPRLRVTARRRSKNAAFEIASIEEL